VVTLADHRHRLEAADIDISLDSRGRALDNVVVERRWLFRDIDIRAACIARIK
jgi:hypothetical protein